MGLNQREGKDLLNLMCGKLLGSGAYRHVYLSAMDPTKVIKYERQNKNRSNIFEYDMWLAFKDEELAKWLAPCYGLSPDGTWLIQSFTEELQRNQLPDMVPSIFCDLKRENWGMFEGRVVCRDYGNNLLHRAALRPGKKLVKADWSRDGHLYQL